MESPSWQSILRESFVYDHYANSAWLERVLTEGDEESVRVFKHILAASEIWVTRLEGVSLPTMPEMKVNSEVIASLRDRWVAAIDKIAYAETIHYQNTRGEAFARSFGDIARHVVNHGTYHRGQLREMFGRKGIVFPETDYIGFAFVRDEGKL